MPSPPAPLPSTGEGRLRVVPSPPAPLPSTGEGRLRVMPSPPAPLSVGEGRLLAATSASATFRRRPRALLEYQP